MNYEPNTITPSVVDKSQVIRSEWYQSLSKYEKPNLPKAIWQMLNTLVPYIALWVLMVYMVKHSISYWLLLPVMVVAAGLLVRVFIFFHDCGHGSFLPSRRANHIIGYLTGILTFTPYEDWRHEHAGHHATAEDLDRRGKGDIWTWTVKEYQEAPKSKQITYRLFRSPFVMFVLGPPTLFVITQRIPRKGAGKRERNSVLMTDLGLLVLMVLMTKLIGLSTYLLIQMPVIFLAAAFGVWLFYVQHQFEEVYWARHQEWDPIRAALEGSSYYKLPKVLQWFSGNIGLHHIHHLRPRIPNYNLQECYDNVPELQNVEILTLKKSLQCPFLNLWDEPEQKMISFRSLKRQPRRVMSPVGESKS